MKNLINWSRRLPLAVAFLVPGYSSASGAAPSGSPVDRHGQLRVEGTQLVDKLGKPVQLRGMSSFWLNHIGEFSNYRSIKWMKDDWGITLFRAAMGVEARKGYLENPEEMTEKVDEIVDACTRLGLYVIIDYHSHHADQDVEAARAFFNRMSIEYGDLPNVIYEPWNEPQDASWSLDIKPYMETITAVIRANDPDNIILSGTPKWSARPDEAAEDPLEDPNTMVVLHFYTGTHKRNIRDRADYALKKGVPVFVSEFGISHHDGGQSDDKVYLDEADRWMEWMDDNKISWANWSLADKKEASAALKPGASTRGGWNTNDLSESGKYIRQQLRNRKTK